MAQANCVLSTPPLNASKTQNNVQTRRSALAFLITAAVSTSAAYALASDDSDSHLLELADKVMALRARNKEINAEQVWPFDEEYDRLLGEIVTAESLEAAWAFSKSSGREAGLIASNAMLCQVDALVMRMWAIPAKTVAGRQAKVKTLFLHCLQGIDDWFDNDRDADWHIEMTRQLLCELSGMSVVQLLGEVQRC